MRWLNRRAIAAWGLISATAILPGHATAFDTEQPVAAPADSLTYVQINPAIQMATAWGDRSTGPHGTFGEFPPNFETPMHTHSGGYHGIVIEGVMTNPFAGNDDIPELGPGSYWYVPANAVHATACVSDTPCRFYFQADGGFDFFEVD